MDMKLYDRCRIREFSVASRETYTISTFFASLESRMPSATEGYLLAKTRDYVDEEASAFIFRLSQRQQANYGLLRDELIDKFEPLKTTNDCLRNFRTCKQLEGESVVDFTIRFEQMLEDLQTRSPGLYSFSYNFV